MTDSFYSHGKLLITAEYLVINGAKALALPLKPGQSMRVGSQNSGVLNWLSLENGNCFFNAVFNMVDFGIESSSDNEKATYISKLFKAVRILNPNFLTDCKGAFVNTNIEFNLQWGLGSSSTLINNMATWGKVNPFELNALISKGSGYDIACASATESIIYQLIDKKPNVTPIAFKPPFIEQLNLVYLNKKMPTENNIGSYLNKSTPLQGTIDQVNELTQQIIDCKLLSEFIELITNHERIIASEIRQTPIKNLLFADFDGAIKSLGAWGGDFILTASTQNSEKIKKYFNIKGYKTVIALKDLLL